MTAGVAGAYSDDDDDDNDGDDDDTKMIKSRMCRARLSVHRIHETYHGVLIDLTNRSATCMIVKRVQLIHLLAAYGNPHPHYSPRCCRSRTGSRWLSCTRVFRAGMRSSPPINGVFGGK